ncbi:hypothetical protein J6590_013606 [Homalodisca vitripennis]|nr:hypothetical protein J6590_013606 [Homalodisca vitripennis]
MEYSSATEPTKRKPSIYWYVISSGRSSPASFLNKYYSPPAATEPTKRKPPIYWYVISSGRSNTLMEYSSATEPTKRKPPIYWYVISSGRSNTLMEYSSATEPTKRKPPIYWYVISSLVQSSTHSWNIVQQQNQQNLWLLGKPPVYWYVISSGCSVQHTLMEYSSATEPTKRKPPIYCVPSLTNTTALLLVTFAYRHTQLLVLVEYSSATEPTKRKPPIYWYVISSGRSSPAFLP